VQEQGGRPLAAAMTVQLAARDGDQEGLLDHEPTLRPVV
jgi:hypothetical protein